MKRRTFLVHISYPVSLSDGEIESFIRDALQSAVWELPRHETALRQIDAETAHVEVQTRFPGPAPKPVLET